MPKKRHNPAFAKPNDTPHHTLLSSGHRNSHNDQYRSSAASSQQPPSVNDLIHHLRHTQVSNDSQTASPSRFVAPCSVHPSLRNLLELPETPPPRPRPNAHRTGVGGSRLRRTPGPPPPESWLLGYGHENDIDQDGGDLVNAPAEMERVINRLDRLPGTAFPLKNALLHMALKAMAQHWAWHVAYDGAFLSMLPGHVKVLLLSYVAVFARYQLLKGLGRALLKPLFARDESGEADASDCISRLDLGGALGRWMSFKELNSELFLLQKPGSVSVEVKPKEEAVPTSWEDAYEEERQYRQAAPIPKALDHKSLRFPQLRYLSLAHPHPASANWKSLLKLLSYLSTITHLSLAHWPVPTFTPNAMNARIRNPAHRSLTFAYSGTDAYAAMENNWAEAASILRKLSHVTYCLKWLDLEGCGEWFDALCWEESGPGLGGKSLTAGPEWNGAWRDIEFMRLGAGWLPHVDGSEIPGLCKSSPPPPPPPLRSLTTSIHAPPPSLSRIRGIPEDDFDSGNPPWDVEFERIKYRRTKELERYREVMRVSREVQQRLRRVRQEGRGKWVRFEFGIEEFGEDVARELLGEELYPLFAS